MKRLVLSALMLQLSLGFLGSQKLTVVAKEDAPMSVAVHASSCSEHSQHHHEHLALETHQPCGGGEQCILHVEMPFTERTALAVDSIGMIIRPASVPPKLSAQSTLIVRTIFVPPSPHHSVVWRV